MSPAPTRRKRRGITPPAPAPPLPPRHPAVLVAAAFAALSLAFAVTFRIDDPDVWQHLLVGKAIWALHAIPRTNLWSWPTLGEPQVLPSWGFRALLWPFWMAGGEWGLAAWRWLSTLAAFGLLWAAARRLGTRGLTVFVVLVLCGLIYRKRSQVRPETLVAVLLALEIWILELRRSGGRDLAAWLVPLIWAWANVHISYPIAFAVLGFHALEDLLARRGTSRAPAPRSRSALIVIGLLALAASFANPFGWRALWQPFEYFLTWRHEMIFRGIGELQPVEWRYNLWNGLPLLLAAWPLLALWRARRAGLDRVEALMLVAFFVIGLRTQRFLGFLALAAAPYLARDLDAWIASRRWPAWSTPSATRAVLAVLACVLLPIPEWLTARYTPGVRMDLTQTPVAACDFMAAHGVRGRGFNPFHFGGYMLWRFWPDSTRLPFMDIHQTGTPMDRALSAAALSSRRAYRQLTERYAFDYALVDRRIPAQYPLLDFLDQDSTFALVFEDDVAAIFLRRAGPLAGVADSLAFRAWPAGFSNLDGVYRRYRADSAYRAAANADLARQVAESRSNAEAHNVRANLALLSGRADDAERELRAALAASPSGVDKAHERLGLIALRAGRPRDAVREFEIERRLDPRGSELELVLGVAWQEIGDTGRARDWYRRAIRRHPENQEARDSLAALGRRPGR